MNLRKALMAASSLLFLLPAFAEEDGYVRLLAESGYAQTQGFAGAKWSKPVVDSSTTDYLVADGLIFSTAHKEYSVSARSITFGEKNGKAGHFRVYYSVDYIGEGGLVFVKGTSWKHYADITLGGKVTVKSPLNEPYVFYNDGNRGGFWRFSGTFGAEEDCGIVVFSAKKNTNQPFTFSLAGDVSKYYGSIVVTSQYVSAGSPIGATLEFTENASSFGGSVVLEDGAVLYPAVSTSVNSLTLKKGAALKFTAGQSLSVRSSLVLPAGKIPVIIEAYPILSEPVRYDLISMPADVECSAENFVFDDKSYCKWMNTKFDMRVTDGGTKVLSVICYPTVKLAKDNEEYGKTLEGAVSAEIDGSYWENNMPVQGDVNYTVSKLSKTTYLTTRYSTDQSLIFAGRSLLFGGTTAMNLRAVDYTVTNLYFNSGNIGTTIYGMSGKDQVLRGHYIKVAGKVVLTTLESGSVTLSGNICGTTDSLLVVQGRSEATSLCRGIFEFDGDNTAYQGRILLTLGRISSLTFGSQFTSLTVRQPENLGGPCPKFTFDALRIDAASRLDVVEDIVLSEPTRGIFVDWQGRFRVAEDKCLTINQQLTVNGRVYKEGAGTLELGGNLRFLDTEGVVTETIPADASNRTFFVVGGFVKPITAHALDGLDVVFSNKTSKIETGLMLDMDPQDQVMKEKGICNIKSPSPFEFRDDDTQKKIPVHIVSDDEDAVNKTTFAVMTVKAGCESVFDRLQIVRPANYKSHKIILETVTDADAGTVTLKTTFRHYGSVFSVR